VCSKICEVLNVIVNEVVVILLLFLSFSPDCSKLSYGGGPRL